MTPPVNRPNTVARDGTRAEVKTRARNSQEQLPGVVQPTIKRTACHPVPRIGETAVYQPCPRCHRHVLTARVDGLIISCDLEHLTIPGELAARLSGLATYDVHVYGLPRKMHLEYRNLFKVRVPRKYPVVARHRCGTEIAVLSAAAGGMARDIVIPYGQPFPDKPPF